MRKIIFLLIFLFIQGCGDTYYSVTPDITVQDATSGNVVVTTNILGEQS